MSVSAGWAPGCGAGSGFFDRVRSSGGGRWYAGCRGTARRMTEHVEAVDDVEARWAVASPVSRRSWVPGHVRRPWRHTGTGSDQRAGTAVEVFADGGTAAKSSNGGSRGRPPTAHNDRRTGARTITAVPPTVRDAEVVRDAVPRRTEDHGQYRGLEPRPTTGTSAVGRRSAQQLPPEAPGFPS